MRKYTVKTGDTLFGISIKMYGVGTKYPLIIESNSILQKRKASGDIALDGNPTIYSLPQPDILNIPDETENIVNLPETKAPAETINNDEPDSTIIKIGANQFRFPIGWSYTSQLDSLDTLSLSAPNFETDEYKESFQSLTFKEAQVYVGNDLFFSGVLINPQKEIEPESKTLSPTFYPSCGKLNDCSIPFSAFPIEKKGLNLKQWAEFIGKIFGQQIEFIGDPGAPFEKVGMKPTEKALSFLIKLAKKRGFHTTNNTKGQLKIYKPELGKSVGFYKEGEPPFISCKHNSNPQNYFSEITGITPTTKTQKSDSNTWENPFLDDFRPQNIEIKDVDNADLKQAVESAAARMFGQTSTYTLELSTIKNQDGDFFKAGQVITLYAPSGECNIEYDFIIAPAGINKAPDGDKATLTLILPGAVTGTLPEAVPWQA